MNYTDPTDDQVEAAREAEYHNSPNGIEITHAQCLGCAFQTTDSETLELWNGYGDCPNCYSPNARWSLTDGSITDVYLNDDGTQRRIVR